MNNRTANIIVQEAGLYYASLTQQTLWRALMKLHGLKGAYRIGSRIVEYGDRLHEFEDDVRNNRTFDPTGL